MKLFSFLTPIWLAGFVAEFAVNGQRETEQLCAIFRNKQTSPVVVCSRFWMRNGLEKPLEELLEDFEHRSETKEITIFYPELKNMTNNLSALFPNLKSLIIKHLESNNLTATDLRPFAFIEKLQIESSNLTNIANDAFMNFNNLRYLNLHNNQINHLPDNLHIQLPLIETLILSENPLSESAVESIGKICSLSELDLTNCKLNRMLLDDSCCLHDLRILRLEGNKFVKILKSRPFYNLFDIEISHEGDVEDIFSVLGRTNSLNSLKITAFSGLNFDIELLGHCPKLKKLTLSNGKISRIPRGNNQTDQKIMHLDLSKNDIEEIGAIDLRFWSKIHVLLLNYNRIQFIDPLAFFQLPYLTKVELGFNYIFELNSQHFKHNSLLRALTLKFNRISEIPSDLFATTPYLEYLDVSNNKIKSFDMSMLKKDHLPIKEIICYFNKLKYLIFNLTSTESAVSYLLRNAAIIPEPIFWDIEKLCGFDTGLNIPMALCSEIQMAKFISAISNLWTNESIDTRKFIFLIISHRKHNVTFVPIEKLNKFNFDSIMSWDLSQNRIDCLKSKDFNNLRNLKYLSLRSNVIEQIDPRTFEQTPNLKALDLGYNRLLTIHEDTFSFLAHLTYLSLADNKITVLEGNLLRNLDSLAILDLSENPIMTVSYWMINRLPNFGLVKLNPLYISEIIANNVTRDN